MASTGVISSEMSTSLARFVLAALGAVAMTSAARPARAYTIETPITNGCHEKATATALRNVRVALPSTAAIIPPTKDQTALITDLQFNVPDDLREMAGTSVLIAVRDNDLRGRGSAELNRLAAVHGDPEHQEEHCLRQRSDDEPHGTTLAIDRCHQFILDRVNDALDGLDAQGVPDPAKGYAINVTLALRGQVTPNLPSFWINMGKALHAVQDSFAHAFRSDDRSHITVALNWIDYVEKKSDETRDGPEHRGELDSCEDVDDLRARTYAKAIEASTELLMDVLDPAHDRTIKLAAVNATLDKYVGVQTGCTATNNWCNSPELKYTVSSGCGCSMPGGTKGSGAALALVAAGAVMIARRRRKRMAQAFASAACLVSTMTAFEARAQARETKPASTVVDPPPPVGTPAATPGEPPKGVPTIEERKDEQKEAVHKASLLHLYAAGSGSVTNPSLNGQLGIRFQLSDSWMVGVDGEINGWFSVQTRPLRTGALNIYATVVHRYPLRFEAVNLRSTLNLGTSTMLIDLFGAPAGTTGLYFGFTPLGLEWKVSKKLFVIFDALGIALPVPQLSGVPFFYPQYRTSVGLELAL